MEENFVPGAQPIKYKDPKEPKETITRLDDPVELTVEERAQLIKQVEEELKLTRDAYNNKLEIHKTRLKLYNNQRRDEDTVGDTTLFTTINTIVAALYDDQLSVEFEPGEFGDIEQAENLDGVAKYDYTKMGKDQLDYYWIWDTVFFGAGYVNMYNYDRKKKLSQPELIDPLSLLKDPDAKSLNGDINRNGAARFWGRFITKSHASVSNNKSFDISGLRAGYDKNSERYKAQQARKDAQGVDQVQDADLVAPKPTDNSQYELLEWFTHFKGKKCVVYLGNDLSKIVKYNVLGDLDDIWKVAERHLYPISHENNGVSVCDLVEDKQRHRAVTLNLAMRQMKYELFPSWLYNRNVIKNPNALRQVGFNKFIPVDGNPQGLVEALNKTTTTDKAMVQYILDSLDQAAQKATSTPELQQGIISEQKRTLGELNLISNKVDSRLSLAFKIFGWSEKFFWYLWFRNYAEKMNSDIDDKVIKIKGAYGFRFKKLTKAEIVGNAEPDIIINSKLIAEAERQKRQQYLMALISVLGAIPDANMRYILKQIMRSFDIPEDEIERMLPPTTDERIARQENAALSANDDVEVQPNDDHLLHLEMHQMAADTDAKWAHIKTHEEALAIKKDNPALFQPTERERAAEQAAKNGQGVSTTLGISLSGGQGAQQPQQNMAMTGQ